MGTLYYLPSMAALAACLASLLSITNQRMDANELLHLAFVGGCAGVGAALFGLGSFTWLKISGYELLSAGKQRPIQAIPEWAVDHPAGTAGGRWGL